LPEHIYCAVFYYKPGFLIILFNMKKVLPLLLMLPLCIAMSGTTGSGQGANRTDANVFGHVVSSVDGIHIPFINVVIEGTRIGTITDVSGHYILTNLPAGTHKLVVRGMGYETGEVSFEISAGQSIEIDVEVYFAGVNLDEVVITASPTSSGFRYQPDMVYMGEELQRRSESSFGEMLNGEPGVAMRSLGSATARPVIRGMDGDRILILQNGERMGDISETAADHVISLDPAVASRIEVVRGPASLLYGSSAIGGVINLMTTDIPERWDMGSSGVISLQGASMNQMGAGFGRYTYGKDKLAVSGRFARRSASDIRTPDGVVNGTSMSNMDASLGAGFITGRTTGGISVSLSDMLYEIPDDIFDPDQGVEIKIKRQSMQGRFNFGNDGFFDRGQLRFNVSNFFQQEIEYEFQDGTTGRDVIMEFGKKAFSSTYTLQHKPFRIFDRGAVGINLHGHNLEVGGNDALIPGELRINFGVFTFQEIPLSRWVRLQAGLRFDFQHTETIQNNAFRDIDRSRNAVNYSGSIGLNHRPIEGLEIGGQFARSHRNPSVEELFAYGAHLGSGMFEMGNVDIRDEIGQGVDLFVRWAGGYVDIEVAGFVNYFRNYIIFEPVGVTDPVSGYPVFQHQGDEARLMGGEISSSIKLSDNLILGLGTDYVNGRRLGNGNINLPFIPPLRFRTDFEYNFGKAWVGGKLNSASTQRRVAPEEEVTGGYTLLGLSAGYRINSFGSQLIILRIDNLLDERYRDHLSRIEDRGALMPGRNFNLTYRLFF
jgi:iron complex outermembrane recepter protein